MQTFKALYSVINQFSQCEQAFLVENIHDQIQQKCEFSKTVTVWLWESSQGFYPNKEL